MPRFFENESLAVLYALDDMGKQERALVERLFEAFSKHPRPADCVPLAPVSYNGEPPRDRWPTKWDRTIARDRKREQWRRLWWNPLRDEIIQFLRDNGHPFSKGRPIQWIEDAYENDGVHIEEDSMFVIWDILVVIQEWIDTYVGEKEVYPEFEPLPVVVLTNKKAEARYKGGVARSRVV